MKQDTLEGKAKTKNGVKRLCFSIICILLEERLTDFNAMLEDSACIGRNYPLCGRRKMATL